MAEKEIKGFFSKNFKLHGEVRKVEKKESSFTSKKSGQEVETSWLEVRVLDDDEDSLLVFVDKDVSRIDEYKKGTVGTFTLRIDFEPKFGTGKYDSSMYLIDFKED